ncbi:MAG TPA: flagellar basal body P-ring protein FlgI, partial [Gemmataceae bacterium]|nr:flagellar basal body P-ring protein FlgI [Gemmataceae bacterium]
MNRRVLLMAALLLGLVGCFNAQKRGQAPEDSGDRLEPELKALKVIGDVTVDAGGSTGIEISGVGLVCGLEGTGGGVPPGDFRRMLEEQLQKKGVQNVKEILLSSNHTMVLLHTVIPVGTRKGDKVDVKVTLPQGSRTTSLRGGYLYESPMMDYQARQSQQGGISVLKGHNLAHAAGPLFVDFGEDSEGARLHGMIWGGAVSHIDSPYVLYLKNDNNVASVANAVANRINSAFPDDAQKQYLVRQTKRLLVLDEVANGINEKFHAPNGLGRGETALASGNGAIHVNVPLEYALNPERFRDVVKFIPLRDSPEVMLKYRKKLTEMLLDPKETVFAALRLEALGKDSIPALQMGLGSELALVRFASAEALTYLGSTAGIEELARLAEQHETLRGSCCLAMTSLNESVTRTKLTAMLQSSKPQVRMGAFRALLVMSEAGPQASTPLNGEMLNDSFWLHSVAPSSTTPLVHIATRRRAEIVMFGESPMLVPPLRMLAGQFTVTAEPGDTRCTVSRYVESAGNPTRKQCGFKLEDVVHTM